MFKESHRWVILSGKPRGTSVSAFLKDLGECPCDRHAWRGYWGDRYHQGYAVVYIEGARHPLVDGVLDEEKSLGMLDSALAVEVVRARLADPRFDEGVGNSLKVPPPWFSAPGWPPQAAEEARAWWKGAKP